MVEKVIGYLDSKGGVHTTEQEAKKLSRYYAIKNIVTKYTATQDHNSRYEIADMIIFAFEELSVAMKKEY